MLLKSYQGRYDCPVKFTITKCETGWTKLEALINGEHIDFKISALFGKIKILLIFYKTIRTKAHDFNRGMSSVRISKLLIVSHIYSIIIYTKRKYLHIMDIIFVKATLC